MHPFFEPLSQRETMLLLTTLTVGGSESVSILEHLPPEAGQRIREKAQALLAIPSDKRVRFMVKQMDEALKFKGLRGVERVDPSWVLSQMKGETPRTVAAILVGMPPTVVRSVLKRLPPAIRKNLPKREELKAAPVELVRAVRQIFESNFHAMPTSHGDRFGFRDIIHLDRGDLARVIRDQGLVELGQAFAAVGKLALAELCRRLERSKAEELIQAVRQASRLDVPDIKTAQRFLARVVLNFSDADEFFHKAGLWRVAKACLVEDPSFREAFRQRLPKDQGLLYASFLEKAAEMEDLTEEMLRRVQDGLLVRMQGLATQEAIAPRWGTVELALSDPNFADGPAA